MGCGGGLDLSAPSQISCVQTISSALIGQANYDETPLLSGTARGRIGYAFDRAPVYARGGFASTYDQLSRTTRTDGLGAFCNRRRLRLRSLLRRPLLPA